MRNAEDVLNVIRDRGRRKLPLEDVYRQLYNPALYLRAYDRLYRNKGAMTPGTTEETVDAMSLAKIEALIEDLRYERYRWTPVRRIEIPKPKQPGRKRLLGLPTWSDKLLQEVMRLLLEAYYEPQFSHLSHGFRPERGCHTALTTIATTWTGTKWFIEGDIQGCFDNIDHSVLMGILRENLHDNRFLRLIASLLQAGYTEQWDYHPTFSGTPQGGVLSPLLSNIYLDRLDKFVEQTLLPDYTRGNRRRKNPEYYRLNYLASQRRKDGQYQEAKEFRRQYQRLSSGDPNDPDYRRLHYLRYADDFLLGFIGPKAEAEEIKEKLATFLRETLHLEMSPEKTLITHATTEAARFLGYEIVNQQCDTRHDRQGHRSTNGTLGLRMPAKVLEERCRQYLRNGKPAHRSLLLNEADYGILTHYQVEYRGFVNYYLLAQNVSWIRKLHRVMQVSLMKTLAAKHKKSVNEVAKKYKTSIPTEHGPRKCLQVTVQREGKKPLVAYFGGIPLRRQTSAVLKDNALRHAYFCKRSELVKRLLAETCELCGSTQNVEVHHIRKLADLHRPGRREKPVWVRIMAERKRKTLVVCRRCHVNITYGRPLTTMSTE